LSDEFGEDFLFGEVLRSDPDGVRCLSR